MVQFIQVAKIAFAQSLNRILFCCNRHRV
jgi:hypothetical protein